MVAPLRFVERDLHGAAYRRATGSTAALAMSCSTSIDEYQTSSARMPAKRRILVR